MPEGAAPAAGSAGVPVVPEREAHRLCEAGALAEHGRAFVFDVLLWGQAARAFALRFGGRVVAYLNRCSHVPVEMDWQPGEFLDHDRRWIVCAIHGATYEPADGRCIGGPCGRGRLMPLEVHEAGGQVYWYPSRDIRPVSAAAPASSTPPAVPPSASPSAPPAA